MAQQNTRTARTATPARVVAPTETVVATVDVAVEPGDEIRPRSSRWHGLLEGPAEQTAVELLGLFKVRLPRVDPARHPLGITVSLEQRRACVL